MVDKFFRADLFGSQDTLPNFKDIAGPRDQGRVALGQC